MDDQRVNIETAISSKDWQGAVERLRCFWLGDNTSGAASFAVASYEKLRHAVEFTPYRIVILRSFTTEPMTPLLRAHGFAHSLDIQVETGEFNAFTQELFRADSLAYGSEVDSVILAVLTRDIAPELWGLINDAKIDFPAVVERVCKHFNTLIKHFRAHSSANLIVHNLEKPSWASDGLLDDQRVSGQSKSIDIINKQLCEMAAATIGTFVLDYDALTARYGRLKWQDNSKWYSMRLPIAARHLSDMAYEWLRFIVPLSGNIAKAVAVDLDNTLWGGVVGEDAFEGIALGVEYPGILYQNVQRKLLDLHHRGVVLSICSKNNYEEAMRVIKDHPGMILRPDHFAAMRINWNEKWQNMKELSRELSLGLEAIAFVDDNPVERDQMRRLLPAVLTVNLPPDPSGFAEAVQRFPFFERLQISDEDTNRAQYYATRTKVTSLAETAGSAEEFLASLEQKVEIQTISPLNLSRVAQLIQKTNQFNLTTRRYNEQQLLNMQNGLGFTIKTIKVVDRFGDNGLVGVSITNDEADLRSIDTFLLSCRVIGRGVETALLSEVCERAAAKGLRMVQGIFIPSAKNAPARDFYPKHGFQLIEKKGGAEIWELNLTATTVAWPRWIVRNH